MLLSFALIFLAGMLLGKLFEKLKLPELLGMLLVGMVLGPYVLNLMDASILNISSELRQIALIIILTRAGLNLDIQDLKEVGRPAMLLCFVPACFEILGMLLFAPKILGISLLEAALLGTVVAAVSPAVIVPRMLKMMEGGYGKDKKIPQMILAGASVDDVFVIVLFASFLKLLETNHFDAMSLLAIPSSIAFGILGGSAVGFILAFVFSRFHIRDSAKVLIILSFAFLLVSVESWMPSNLGFSGLLAVMALGATIQQKRQDLSKRLSSKFSKLWIGAEILLFVLVGASVNIQYAFRAGLAAMLLIAIVLVFRMLGVVVSLWRTKLNYKEKIFTVISYMPKATVQAAIGGVPLSLGLASGEMILTVAVLSILMTAPIGAILMDRTYPKLLKFTNEKR